MPNSALRIFLPSLFLLFISCEDNEPSGSTVPANLSVSVAVAEDGTGTVDISATADNTVEYRFYMGDALDAEPIVQTNGKLSYTYKSTGVYVVETRAYGSSGKFIRSENRLSVIVENGTEPDDGYSTPPAYDGMTLIWSDEFSSANLDETYWTFEEGTGNNGWGNNELQYYRKENTSLSNGYLTIEARKEAFSGSEYTSSRMVTMNKFSFKYGRVDIRAKLPKGQGLWPALWMLGSNFQSAGWPSCGEIDIMEMVGGANTANPPRGDNKVHGTTHWDNNGSKADIGSHFTLSEGSFNDKFHVFTLEWTANELKWYVDDQLYFTDDITDGNKSEFRSNFFFIFNVAVGGIWPGSPNETTVFPQQMVVDYVRVFQPN